MLWQRYLERVQDLFGVTIITLNQTPVTLSSIVAFLAILALFVLAARLLGHLLNRRILSRFHMDEGTKYNLERLTRYTIVILGAIISFQFVGIDLSGLAVILGLFSVGVGFGLQNVTSNFVAGIILLFEKPIKVGDRVTIGADLGDVVQINMRSTTISTIDNIDIIVPNSEFIAGRVTNWSHGDKTIRINIDVGVSYNSDLEKVLKCLKEVPLTNPNVLKHPQPVVHFMSFGDSSWNFKLRCWIPTPELYWQVISDLHCEIVHKFKEYNIEIPYPQRDLHVRSSIPVPTRIEPPATSAAGGTQKYH